MNKKPNGKSRLISLTLLGFSLVALPAASQQVLSGHVPGAIPRLRLQPMGRLASTNRLHLAIGLPLRNPEALSNLLRQIYDPANTNYHHYLTPKQFTKMFGPTEQDYQSVIAFAESNGWVVTGQHAGRVILDVSAAVPDIEKACHVKLQVYQHPTERRTFYAPDRNPSLDLATPVSSIAGLDNYIIPHPADLEAGPRPGAGVADGSGTGGYLQGLDFRSAYAQGVSLDGNGQTAGLLEFDGFYTNDISLYETNSGLPAVPISVETVDGFDGSPDNATNHIGEVSLDIEMLISMAPGLSQLIVYETVSGNPADDLLQQMADDGTAAQISSSWFFKPDATTDSLLQQLAMQGQSFFEASGDDNAYSDGINFLEHAGPPADDPYLTSVGGTTLTLGGQGYWEAETVWNNLINGTGTNGSGGGISTEYSIPTWQAGVANSINHASATMRNVPDVAMAADNVWIIYNNGETGSVWGTSCAAPLWAGFTALVNQQCSNLGNPPVGFLNPAIYALGKSTNYAAAFHDIVTGNNTNYASSNLFLAVPGYDLCTGWGTPAGMNLIDALSSTDSLFIAPAAGFAAVAGAVGGPFSPASQNFQLKNGGTASLSWSAGSESSLLAVSTTSGTLGPGKTAPVTVSLTASAKTLPEGFYTASIVFSNLTLGTVQNRRFTVQVGTPPLTFDDLTGSGHRVPAGYGGIDWSNFYSMDAVTILSNPNGYRAGMVSAPDVLYNYDGNPATLCGPVSFDLLSADLTAAWRNNLTLQVEAYAGPSLVYNHTLILNATAPTTVNFNLKNVNTVVFISSNGILAGYSGHGEQFVMDNVTIVPHYPATDAPAKTSSPVESVSDKALVASVGPGIPAGETVALCLNAKVGGMYQLQYSTNLTNPEWINVGTSFTATNSMVTISDSATNHQRFYRLLLLP